ncbi:MULTISPECIES: DUF3592 domain-containing protein [unclassified Kribbella]|uniref:DUF3592 domain-containing protein n=1 Tax=unclassified Kribbella TaxID=2644121 RepID=UPI00340C6DA7
MTSGRRWEMTPEDEGTREKRRWRVAPEGVIFVFIAVLMAGVGYSEIQDELALERRGEVVTATVLHKETAPRSGEPIDIRFVTKDGETVETTTENYSAAEVGQRIQVVYDPMKPTRVQSADLGYEYQSSVVVFGGGAVAILVVSLSRFWSRPTEADDSTAAPG